MNKLRIGNYSDEYSVLPAEIDVTNVGKDNLSMLVTGASGSGKTVAIQKILCQLADGDTPVLVIDVHGTMAPDQVYEPIRAEFEEKANRLDAYTQPIGCHLLDSAEFPDGTIEKSRDIASSLAEIFTNHYSFGPVQSSELTSAIKSVIDNSTFWDDGIIAVKESLKNESIKKSSTTVLERLDSLFESNVFQDGELFIKPKKINILDLSRYNPKLQAVISEIFLYHLWHLSFTGHRYPFYVCIDEFQNIGMSKNGILSRILAEGRKYGINCILITQSLGIHFNTAQQKLLCQTRFKLFFRPSEVDIKSCLGLISGKNETDNYRLLKLLKTGEFLVTGPVLIGGKIDENVEIMKIFPSENVSSSVRPKHILTVES